MPEPGLPVRLPLPAICDTLRGMLLRSCLSLGLIGWIGLACSAGEPVTPPEFDRAFAELQSLQGRTNETGRLRGLFALQWRYAMIENPEAATGYGYPGQNERWTDLSPAAEARRRTELARPERVLAGIDRSALGADDLLWAELFQRLLALDREGLRFPSEYLRLNQMEGVQREVPDLIAMMPTAKAADYAAILARLRSVPVLVRQNLALLREGLAKGITPPRITLRDVPAQVLSLVPPDPTESALYRPFQEISPTVPSTEHAVLRAAARAALTNGVYAAFQELHRFLVDEYVPRAREGIACRDLPDGAAWYAFNARRQTTTDLTPAQIHALGLSEVKRIRAEMERLKAEVGFTGDLPAFFQHLRTEPRFFHESGTALLAGYRDIAKRIDLELPRLFGKLPRLPYGVIAIPGYSERSQTTGYYQPGSLEAGRPGAFYANTYDLRMRPKWEMEALTLHEAVPGHHLQIALAQELEGVPEFQRFGHVTAFVEGWGLYSESLGSALGLYRDPYSKFGQLTYEIWRAIRLVVDTGMHDLGWSRQQAIDYFQANAGKTEHDITVEVDRYIVWPGQALAYKVGELRIQALRREAEQALGGRFDVRRFHDELLGHGPLPLNVLEPRLRSWIQAQALPEK